MKLHHFGENELTIETAHYVQLQVGLGNLYEGQDYWLQSEFQNLSAEYLGDGGLGRSIVSLGTGDSASFIMPYRLLKESLLDEYAVDERKVPDTLMMKLEIGVSALLTKEEFTLLRQKEIQKGIVEENEFLQSFLIEEGLFHECDTVADIYIQQLRRTENEKISWGATIELDYRSYFLDGTEFDNTKTGQSTMWFDVGKPDQVVRALELALVRMNHNDSIRVYAPSHMTFGQNGSTTGVVPPLTPVYFDVRARIFGPDSLN